MRTISDIRPHVPRRGRGSSSSSSNGGNGANSDGAGASAGRSSFPSLPESDYVRGHGGGGGDDDGIGDNNRNGVVSSRSGGSNGNSGIIAGGASSDHSSSISSRTDTSHISVSETHREYYLTVSSSSDTASSNTNTDTSISSEHNSYYNNHNGNHPRSISDFGGSGGSDSLIGGSHTDSSLLRNNNSSSIISSSSSSSSLGSGGTTTNRTLSEILSFVENGAASVYRGGGGDTSNDGSPSGSSKSGSNGEISDSGRDNNIGLAIDKILNGQDYNYNGDAGGILFDFGNDFVRNNGSFANIDSVSEQLFNQIEFQMIDDMARYVAPAIIVLGNISNFVAFLVLRRKKFKNSSVAFYMRAYALANLCFLNVMVGVAWFCVVLNLQYLAHRADWSCRLWTFISNVILYSGIWFVVVMGIDRFVYTNLPSKSPGYCSVFTAKGITTFVIICLIVVSIHAMWTYELQPQGCWVSYEDDLHTLTWPWWSATLYSYIPQLLLLLQIVAQTVCFCVRVWLKQPHSPPNARQSGEQDTLVIPVFVITVAFFFFTIPSVVINLLDIHLPSELLRVDVIAKIELTKKITELLSSFNNCLLGIVLLALSPTYRSELVALTRAIFFCCFRSRTLKVFEMRTISQSDDSSPHMQVDYELCNNNEENVATDV